MNDMESQEVEPLEQDPGELPPGDTPAAAGVDATAMPEAESQVPADLPPEAPAPREETRFRRTARRVLRWSAGILLLYALGVLTATLAFYLPRVREIRSVSGELDLVTARVEQLEKDIEARDEQLATLQAQVGQSQTAQANAQIQIYILTAQLDIAEARLSLERDEPDSALLALNTTSATLDNLAGLVGADQLSAIESMKQRLSLSLSGIESDPDAARLDLEVLAGNLLKIEDAFALENN